MEIKYQIFENKNLYIQKFIGFFSVEKYMRFARYITEYVVSKSIKKILIDFRDLDFSDIADDTAEDFSANLNRVIGIRKNLNKNELKDKDVKVVIWVDKPISTVIAHLFISNFSNMNYNYCSTVNNVVKMLELPEHLENLENIISNLENTFENT